jgi:hypothetical protein
MLKKLTLKNNDINITSTVGNSPLNPMNGIKQGTFYKIQSTKIQKKQ